MKDYYKDEFVFINFSKVSIVKDKTEKVYTHYLEDDYPTLEGERIVLEVIIGSNQIWLKDEKAKVFKRDFEKWLNIREQYL